MRINKMVFSFLILFSCIILNVSAETKIPNQSGKYFELSFIDALSGDSINTKEMQGKTIVVNFWFSECPPCQASTPMLRRLYEKYSSEDVEFIVFPARRSFRI